MNSIAIEVKVETLKPGDRFRLLSPADNTVMHSGTLLYVTPSCAYVKLDGETKHVEFTQAKTGAKIQFDRPADRRVTWCRETKVVRVP